MTTEGNGKITMLMAKVEHPVGGLRDQLQPIITDLKLDEENQNLLVKIDQLNKARVACAEHLERALEKANSLKVEMDCFINPIHNGEIESIRQDILAASAALVIKR